MSQKIGHISEVVVLMIWTNFSPIRLFGFMPMTRRSIPWVTHQWCWSMLWTLKITCYHDGSVWIIYWLVQLKRKLLQSGRHFLNMKKKFFKYEFHINDAKVETQATHNILGVVVGSELTFTLTYGEQLTKHGQSFRVAETTQVHFQGRNGRSLQDVCSPLGIL